MQHHQNVPVIYSNSPVALRSARLTHVHFITKAGIVVMCTLAMISGAFTIVFVMTPICISSGVLLIVVAVSVVTLEAMFFCQWATQQDKSRACFQIRPKWQKAIFYSTAAMLPLIICSVQWTILGFFLLQICSAANGILAFVESRNKKPSGPLQKLETIELV